MIWYVDRVKSCIGGMLEENGCWQLQVHGATKMYDHNSEACPLTKSRPEQNHTTPSERQNMQVIDFIVQTFIVYFNIRYPLPHLQQLLMSNKNQYMIIHDKYPDTMNMKYWNLQCILCYTTHQSADICKWDHRDKLVIFYLWETCSVGHYSCN